MEKSAKRINHEKVDLQLALDKELSSYFNKTIEDLDLRAEAKHQGVLFLEISMGYRNFDDGSVERMVKNIKSRGIITRNHLSEIFEMLEIKESDRKVLTGYWD